MTGVRRNIPGSIATLLKLLILDMNAHSQGGNLCITIVLTLLFSHTSNFNDKRSVHCKKCDEK